MPGQHHEAIVELFRNRTTLAPELLAGALGLELPPYADAVVVEADFPQLAPTSYHADLVVMLKDPTDLRGLIVEVQLNIDEDKLYAWPLYAMALRARAKIPVVLLVVTPERRVERWILDAVAAGRMPIAVAVLGPDSVPVVTDEAESSRAPELGVLSALTHGRDPVVGEAVAIAAAKGLRALDDRRRRLYYDLIKAFVSEAAQRGLEAMFEHGKDGYLSDWANDLVAKGRVEGRGEGLAEGLLLSEAKAAAAETKAWITALHDALVHRQLSLTPEAEARLAAATAEQLRRWTLRAWTAASLDAVFDDA